jgi:hypothetical protein
MIPGIRFIGGMLQEATPVSLSYINRYTADPNATSHTYSISTGVASDDRFIVIGAATTTSSATMTCAIDTISTPALGRGSTFINNSIGTAWFGKLLPSGTTASVRISYSTTVGRGTIAVWSLKNLSRLGEHTDYLETSTSGNIDVSAGGVILAMYGHNEINGDTNVGSTWTGITERFDLELENSIRWSGGDYSTVFGDVAKSISVTPANLGNLTAISFR